MRSVEINGNIFYNGDCIVGAREHIPNDTVDLIITDPPYGINGDRLHRHYNRDEGFVVGGYVEVPAVEYGEILWNWIQEAERILRPGGSIYIVSGYTNLYQVLHALRETGLREVNHIIWKYNFGIYTSRKYVSSHYHILFYEKPGGERTFNLESRYGTGEKSPRNGSLNYRDRGEVPTERVAELPGP
ncbi:DNA methyltransferase [Methanoculleus sp. UBA374]|jgi:site-specific DNA-methyltransferase (adenine-specific)|uniref:DNA-methyltransferase n=3 Tax=Methanoculleus TaxID=45989 RepID=UPI00319E5EEE